MALAKSTEAEQRMDSLESLKLDQLLYITSYIIYCLSSYLAWGKKKAFFPLVTATTFENPPPIKDVLCSPLN